MTELEKETLKVIRNAKDPTRALLAAIEVITDFLQQSLLTPEQEDDSPQAPS